MLINLHVKNIALIEEEEITFGEGLNILTGETGAGKSIILGALGLALGSKASRDMLRDPDRDGLAEAVFAITGERQREALKSLGIETDEDEVILTRRLTGGRTVARINGETVPAARLNEVGSIFIDIYGQNEHQSLLKSGWHLKMLDQYAGEEASSLLAQVSEAYDKYSDLKRQFESASMDAGSRLREIDYLTHEVEEIEDARLQDKEDETLESDYRKMSHAQRIIESLNEAYSCISGEGAASDQIGAALRDVSAAEAYDPSLSGLASSISEIDSLLNDFERDLGSYIEDFSYDEQAFDELTRRLDLVNDLKAKYGPHIPDIQKTLKEKKERLGQLKDYDSYLNALKADLDNAYRLLDDLCGRLTAVRKKYATQLTSEVARSLADLNFLDTRFTMEFAKCGHFTSSGNDTAEFYISVNPGEPLRPLREVASGGELSRIMLAIKTVLAQREDTVDTLVFDEIDAGISGRTAQAVAGKLKVVAREQQVICITHLPQIAAMADRHFLIDKSVVEDRTVSAIRTLSEEDRVRELARMMAGGTITDAVLEGARQLLSAGRQP